jgi:hypothetical protein
MRCKECSSLSEMKDSEEYTHLFVCIYCGVKYNQITGEWIVPDRKVKELMNFTNLKKIMVPVMCYLIIQTAITLLLCFAMWLVGEYISFGKSFVVSFIVTLLTVVVALIAFVTAMSWGDSNSEDHIMDRTKAVKAYKERKKRRSKKKSMFPFGLDTIQ